MIVYTLKETSEEKKPEAVGNEKESKPCMKEPEKIRDEGGLE